MLRFLADENLSNNLIRGLLRRRPLDLVRAREVGLAGASDPIVLAWAADADRIVISRDFRTLPTFAWERISQELSMPGLLLVRAGAAFEGVVADVLLLDDVCDADELRNQVWYLPLE
jgi:hypothetical protein